ncbi:MAG: dicarboxylate/amino acid:cation symporter [Myxococcales bacterium]|nr:dicarboxylate/amino acid:cation symporter [Myxococcales bacterium]
MPSAEPLHDQEPLPIREAGTRAIFAALAVGAAAGILANVTVADSPTLDWTLRNVTDPLGRIWLRSLVMVVVPLVLASLSVGIVGLGDIKRLGRMGGYTMTFFLGATAVSTTLGLVLVNLLHPGAALARETRDRLMATYAGDARSMTTAAGGAKLGMNLLVEIVPANPLGAMAEGNMLSVIFFAVVLGAALLSLPAPRRAPLVGVLEALNDAMIVVIAFVMRLAPLGVFFLLFGVMARFGLDVLRSLALYVVVVVTGLAAHALVVLPAMAKVFAGVRPLAFLRRSRVVWATAFSTSSSSATLPTTLRVLERDFAIPREVSGFVAPLGATMNMNGTALFEGVTALFLAQVFGVELNLSAQVGVVLLATISAIGVAGVPGGSIPLLMVLLSTFGVPPAGIAIILGIDRLLDMCRSSVNVVGDLAAAAFVARRVSGWRDRA